nr:threonine-phosphate decarboxylase CobD [Paenibacillus sp. OSY-SE]
MSMIERFGHGGDVWTAADTFGVSSEAFLDFSANINPLGPPPVVAERLQQALEGIVHYPDPGHRKMKAALSARLQVPQERIGIGNGAAECMALLLLAFQPRVVGVIAPCFSEYEALSRQFGADVVTVVGQEEAGFQATEEQLYQLMLETDLVFIGHPNNPTGIVYDRERLERAARMAEKTNTLLAVDEAFIDFLPQEEKVSLLPVQHQYKQLIIIRSLTKFYAIPGLRLGYAVAHPELIAAMSAKQVTWSVNGLALAAGEALLTDKHYDDYVRATRELIVTERTLLRERLASLGIKTWPSEANFLLCRAPALWTAKRLQEELGRRGILIRNCDMYTGLKAGDFRIAIKNRTLNEHLAVSVQAVLH